MDTRHRLILLLIVVLVAGGCGVTAIDGSGTVITETRDVSGFSAISLNGSGELIISQTGKEALTVTADDNLLPHLISEVHGNQLILSTSNSTSVNPTQPIVYRLEVGKLTDIEISGNASVEAQGLVTTGLKIEASGSTRMNFSGQADTQEISIAGEGNYQAPDLKSKDVTITITGSGTAVVSASDKLDVKVVGSGTIEYIGDPAVTESVMGSGAVRKRS